ncbi:MAG: hypothetical protein ACJ8G5_05680 [Burkholderiales bacterium]
MMTKENLGRWLLVGFLSGAVSVLVCHQVVAALLHAIGMTPRAPYSMQPTNPLGIPQLGSIVFWGGVWGVVLAAALRSYTGRALVIAATIFGAVLPSLVAWTLVAALKGQPLFAGGAPKGLMVGLLVNAAWGLGTGTGLALFGRRGRLKMRAV